MPAPVDLVRPTFIATDTLDAAAFNGVAITGASVPDATPGVSGVLPASTTAAGLALLDDATTAVQRATLGLGSAALQAAAAFDAAGTAAAAVAALGTIGTIASQAANNVSLTGGNISAMASIGSTGALTDALGDVRLIPQNSRSAAYTAALSDGGRHILHPSADTTARTFTIPANSAVAFPIGSAITFVNQNAAGIVTIAITTDTMRLAGAGTTGSRTLAANGIATAIKLTATEWIISGIGLT